MRTLVKSGAGSAVVHVAALGGLLLIDPAAEKVVTIDLTIMPSESMESPAPGEGPAGPPPPAPAPAVPRAPAAPRLARPARTERSRSAALEPSVAPAQTVVPPTSPTPPSEALTAEAPAPEPAGRPGGPEGDGMRGTEATRPTQSGGSSQGIPGAASGAGSGRGAGGAQQAYLTRHYAYIRDAIQRSASYPPLARRMGWVGRVVLAFRLLPDGAIANVRVLKGSGFPVLDSSAVEAVRRASPFPPPPAEAEIVAPVAYALE